MHVNIKIRYEPIGRSQYNIYCNTHNKKKIQTDSVDTIYLYHSKNIFVCRLETKRKKKVLVIKLDLKIMPLWMSIFFIYFFPIQFLNCLHQYNLLNLQ